MVNSQRDALRRVGYNQSHSYPTSANGIIVLLNSLNSKSLEVRNTSGEKSEKIRAKSKKLDEDAMMCNTLRQEIIKVRE